MSGAGRLSHHLPQSPAQSRESSTHISSRYPSGTSIHLNSPLRYHLRIMSTDEQDQAILRIVRQRSELRKRKALIENELRTAGESLEEVSSSIRHISGGVGDWLTRILGKIDAAPE